MKTEILNYLNEDYIVMAVATYYLGYLIKKTRIKDKYIPFIITVFAISAVFMKEIPTIDIANKRQWIELIYTGIIKGLFVSMTTVYINQIIKQSKKDNKN